MVHMVTSIKKHIKLYFKLIKFAISLDLEYRWSFVLMVIVELAFFFITIVSVGVIFSNVTEVAGWNYNQMLILLAGIITIYWGVVGLELNLSVINIILSFVIMILGVLIGYSIGMLITTLSIWFIGASPLTRISEQINFMARIPNNAFFGVWKFVFTFIF